MPALQPGPRPSRSSPSSRLRLAPLLLALCAAALLPPSSRGATTPAVADPTSDTPGGLQSTRVQVSLTTPTRGASVHFTTHAQPPGPAPGAGSVYSSPITIDRTTVLRSVAIHPQLGSSRIDTRTYLFPDDILRQPADPPGFPATWGTNADAPVAADYAMDPEITGDPVQREAILAAFAELPHLCLTASPDALFDPSSGLYSNPRESGAAWERPACIEFFEPGANRRGFRIDAGFRIQGGWNRRPEESPKHAFRLVFRKKYGPAKLHYPLFSDPGPDEFDELILRAGCNNTWLHWKGSERRRGDFIRDQWVRDSLAAMGHDSARGRFVHLHLNGLYWGLYNLVERPAGPFVASRHGGEPSDYDIRNGSNILEGTADAWRELIAFLDQDLTRPGTLDALRPRLDPEAFADFMILNLYGANGDWDGASNWYAARRRQPPGPFRFHAWDGERTLEDLEDSRIDDDAADCPLRLFQRLRQSPEFRTLFAQRARRLLTDNGPLTPEPAARRYRRWSDHLTNAVVAESARWGDYRRDVHRYKEGPYELYTRGTHWAPEVRRLLEDYFPNRTSTVIRQLQSAGLWSISPQP